MGPLVDAEPRVIWTGIRSSRSRRWESGYVHKNKAFVSDQCEQTRQTKWIHNFRHCRGTHPTGNEYRAPSYWSLKADSWANASLAKTPMRQTTPPEYTGRQVCRWTYRRGIPQWFQGTSEGHAYYSRMKYRQYWPLSLRCRIWSNYLPSVRILGPMPDLA